MAYRRRNRLRRRNARPTTKRAIKRIGRGIKGVTSVAYRRPGYGTGGLGAFGTRLGRVGRQRNAARAAVLMQRRRRRAGVGGGGEIGFVNRRAGKFRSMTVNKLMTLGMEKACYRFQGVNRQNADSSATINADGSTTGLGMPGYYTLYNTLSGAAPEYFPLHCYDLTTLPVNSLAGKDVAYQLSIDAGANADVVWQVMAGQTPSGGAAPNYHHEDSNAGPTAVTINQKYIQHDWFDIRLLCYGARQQPTFYDIMVVGLRDHLQPNLYVDPASLDAEDRSAHNSLWQGLVKNISYNSIMPGSKDAFKGMRVIKRFRFVIQPSQTIDSDRTPHQRIVKFFLKDYRIRNYNWGKDPLSTSDTVDGPDFTNNSTWSGARDYPLPSQRMFLIVRASNTTERTPGETSADNTPSYDLVIRKQVRYIGHV